MDKNEVKRKMGFRAYNSKGDDKNRAKCNMGFGCITKIYRVLRLVLTVAMFCGCANGPKSFPSIVKWLQCNGFGEGKAKKEACCRREPESLWKINVSAPSDNESSSRVNGLRTNTSSFQQTKGKLFRNTAGNDEAS